MRTLVVTNDFPPRSGGIQVYLHGLVSRLPPDEVVVYASSYDGAAAFDAAQGFPVVRDRASMLLPTLRVSRDVAAVARAEGCDRVWFGATAPLALMADRLRVDRVVSSTHGHELGWGKLPGATQLLQRMAAQVDVLTALSDYTLTRLARLLPESTLAQLPSGVDTELFRPGAGGGLVRARHGLGDRPVVVCVSRLVARKGQERLVRALPLVQRTVPDAALLLVGGGPMRAKLTALAAELGVTADVTITGEVPWAELPAHYAAGDVFAMPCRDRFAGLEVEGLGIVFLEASATGLPVVVGRSGGSPDTVLDGVTGHLVDGGSREQLADRIASLLGDPAAAAAMGARGRAWMESDWRWEVLATRLRGLLLGP
ncbi:MAG: putative glycosyl transferase [Frankiales bacterium]|nr:putative glycosyl transferase [Frankiales bacterium]